MSKLAVVMDVRSKELFADIRAALRALEASGVTFRVLFLDANDDVLVRRFEQGRRPHPLQGGGRILDGIAAERELVRELKDYRRHRPGHVRPERPWPRHRHHRTVQRDRAGGAAAERHELRLQVRAAGRRQLRGRCPLHPQPALGAAAAPAHRPGQGRQRLRAGGPGRQRLRGTLRPGPRTGPGRLPAREQALRHDRRGLHRRQAPLRGGRRRAVTDGWRSIRASP